MKITNFNLLVLATLAWSMAAGGASLYDDFESYSVGTNLSSLSAQGWGASDNGAIVTNNIFGNTTNLALLPPSVVVTNTFPEGLNGKVWTDCLVDETTRVIPAFLPYIESNTVVMAGVTTDGFAVVYNKDSNGWVTCTTDARGTSISGVVAGAWARLSLCEDFSTHKVALFMDGRLLRQGIPFITNRNSFVKLSFSSGLASTGYVDEVYVNNAIPAALTNQALSSTNDINGDGVKDALEIMMYGRIAKMVPADYATITGALAVAQAGDRIILSNGVYAETVTVSNSMTLSGTSVTGLVALTVCSNQTVVLSGFTLFEVTNLVIQGGGVIQASNVTLNVNGTTYSGTFMLDSGFNGELTRSTLNYTNDFESYATNMPLMQCGGQGWGATKAASIVQGLVFTNSGSKAAKVVSDSLLSNVVAGVIAQSNVWTDVWMNDSAIKYAGAPYPGVDSGLAVMLFVNTNNHVVIRNAGNWDECLQDVAGYDVPLVTTGQWVRVTVYQDFVTTNVALFVNGQLVRQKVPFVSYINKYQGFSLSSGAGASYLDDVKIWTSLPPGLTNGPLSDMDQDGSPDAIEIQNYGDASAYPRGSVFKVR